MSKFNVVVITPDGKRALLSIKDKTVFSKRVAQREAAEYNLTHNRPARICDEDTPMHALDGFVRAYLECALWSTNDDGDKALDDAHDINDIAAMTVEQAISDCDDFRRANPLLLTRAYKLYAATSRGAEWTPEALAGHDFWLTRNGHGAGFWDRGFKGVGDALADAARIYGSVDMYVGDDGKVHA